MANSINQGVDEERDGAEVCEYELKQISKTTI